MQTDVKTSRGSKCNPLHFIVEIAMCLTIGAPSDTEDGTLVMELRGREEKRLLQSDGVGTGLRDSFSLTFCSPVSYSLTSPVTDRKN